MWEFKIPEPLKRDPVRRHRFPNRLFSEIPPQEGVQLCRRQNDDGFAFDREKFLFAKYCERAGKGFADGAQLRREHALGHGELRAGCSLPGFGQRLTSQLARRVSTSLSVKSSS